MLWLFLCLDCSCECAPQSRQWDQLLWALDDPIHVLRAPQLHSRRLRCFQQCWVRHVVFFFFVAILVLIFRRSCHRAPCGPGMVLTSLGTKTILQAIAAVALFSAALMASPLPEALRMKTEKRMEASMVDHMVFGCGSATMQLVSLD